MLKSSKSVVKLIDRLGLLKFPFHWKKWKWVRLCILASLDATILFVCLMLAFIIRFDSLDFGPFYSVFERAAPIVTGIGLISFYLMGMYREVWRHANFRSGLLIIRCVLVTTLISVAVLYLFGPGFRPPRSVPLLFSVLTITLVGFFKFSWRAWCEAVLRVYSLESKPCLVYGAGQSGELLIRHVRSNPNFPFAPVAFLDDDPNKKGRKIHGVLVFGSGEDLVAAAQRYQVKTILIAIHAVPGKVVSDIFEKCKSLGLEAFIVPDIANFILQDKITVRPVNIDDLLRRDPRSIDRNRINGMIADKVVLITGAGGSIGSELVLQVAAGSPREIILVDAGEYNLYNIVNMLSESYPNQRVVPCLVNITNRESLERIFKKNKPDFVFHAAAYKHVHLVEENVSEAFYNNVYGTLNLCDVSVRHKVAHFTMISTDKAVRPSSVMGATKRICEAVVSSFNKLSDEDTVFSIVRFGNVLGSSGSVIPKFLNQIKNGGPVTVSDQGATRYFMLIREAVGLVLQSSTQANGGEIFVLNMGKPVKILDMACQLINLAGKAPYKDIDIVFTGLKSGEKLDEELILHGSEVATLNDDIYCISSNLDIDPEVFIDHILKLCGKPSPLSDTQLRQEIFRICKSIDEKSYAIEGESFAEITGPVH